MFSTLPLANKESRFVCVVSLTRNRARLNQPRPRLHGKPWRNIRLPRTQRGLPPTAFPSDQLTAGAPRQHGLAKSALVEKALLNEAGVFPEPPHPGSGILDVAKRVWLRTVKRGLSGGGVLSIKGFLRPIKAEEESHGVHGPQPFPTVTNQKRFANTHGKREVWVQGKRRWKSIFIATAVKSNSTFCTFIMFVHINEIGNRIQSICVCSTQFRQFLDRNY